MSNSNRVDVLRTFQQNESMFTHPQAIEKFMHGACTSVEPTQLKPFCLLTYICSECIGKLQIVPPKQSAVFGEGVGECVRWEVYVGVGGVWREEYVCVWRGAEGWYGSFHLILTKFTNDNWTPYGG